MRSVIPAGCSGRGKAGFRNVRRARSTCGWSKRKRSRWPWSVNARPAGNGASADAASAGVVLAPGTSCPTDLSTRCVGRRIPARSTRPRFRRRPRVRIPLRSGERTVGALVLADRANSAPHTMEELDLLQCIGDHVTSDLMNLRLANEGARELDAFRLMSTFFVHDLKNAAASLNLTLKNLPVHFDDPAFRDDALRTIANTARRIDEMIARLSELRERPETIRVEADLNQLVSEALDKVSGMANVDVQTELQPLPRILANRDEIQSVVTNLS